MSFMGGGDASCSTGSNPLNQFQKHVQNDQSLQRDRLVGRGPGGMQEGFRSGVGRDAGHGNEMMNEFMSQGPQHMQQPPQQGGPPPFAMEQMRRDFERMNTAGAAPQAQQQNGSNGNGWAAEFDQQGARSPVFKQGGPNAHFSAEEFQSFHTADGRAFDQSATTARPMNYGGMGAMGGMYGGGMYNSGMYGGGMGMYGGGMGMGAGPMHQQPQQMEGKGKGRMVELDDKDWEAQFAQLETSDTQQQEGEAVDGNSQDELDEEARRAMDEQLADIDRNLSDSWRDPDHPSHLTEWENFDQELNTHLRPSETGNYLFEPENIFRDHADPFSEGVRIMDEGGNLTLASLAFEAAVQKDPEHVDAWTRLGAAQAQNEKETPAIRALEQALKLDPTNLESMMGLAVSYTNEGYDTTAYRSLERWLSTKYPQIHPPVDAASTDAYELGFTDRELLRRKVIGLFLDAARLSPDAEHMDPDVQVGLGVLFYGAEEYDNAVDCFNAALASSEAGMTNAETSNQRPLLWNRLGATLANSGKSEEAISAYENALALNPNFVRARYNLGVSCINIGVYEQAAQHLLGALDMHRVVEREAREKAREIVSGGDGTTGQGAVVGDEDLDRIIKHNQSTNLFDTLRRVFGQMDRKDLAEKVGPDMDPRWFMGQLGLGGA